MFAHLFPLYHSGQSTINCNQDKLIYEFNNKVNIWHRKTYTIHTQFNRKNSIDRLTKDKHTHTHSNYTKWLTTIWNIGEMFKNSARELV
jgi:hypothetical protein